MAQPRTAAIGTERERKFLVRKLLSGLSRHLHEQIQQGYLAVGTTGPSAEEVRIRKTGDRAFLTVKRGRGIARQEVEVPLPAPAAKKLWPLTKGRQISKTRYEIRVRGATIQLDIYKGRLQGLVVAEVERPSLQALRRFQPPPWIGRKVTGQRAFSNNQLATGGWPASAPKRR